MGKFGKCGWLATNESLEAQNARLRIERDSLSREISLARREAQAAIDVEFAGRKLAVETEIAKLEVDLLKRKQDAAAEIFEARKLVASLEKEAEVLEKANEEKKAMYDEAVRIVSEAAKKLVESAEKRADAAEKVVSMLAGKLPQVDLSKFTVEVKADKETVVAK